MTTQRDNLLVWVDLEMTGLDEKRDVIIEIATIITDRQLTEIAEGPQLVIHQSGPPIEQMTSLVRRMHQSNGLLDEVSRSTVTLADAEKQTLEFVRTYCAKRTAPLCGNSIWNDRMFLRAGMPSLEAHLHYRVVDVSTLKELARSWSQTVTAGRPAKREGHRALDDIRASIDELRYYRESLLDPHCRANSPTV